MMNHMTVMVGPMGGHMRSGMPAGANAQSGMGMTQGGPALSTENGPSMGRAMGENTGNERAMRTGPQDMKGMDHSGHGGSSSSMQAMPGMQHAGHDMASEGRVPGYPADMMDMMGMMPEAEMRQLEKPETRGMRRNWFTGVEALHTIVRVLPPELYDLMVSGKGDIKPGASVPGGTPGPHEGHQHSGMNKPKEDGAPKGDHKHPQ
jgi:hypothetical protein